MKFENFGNDLHCIVIGSSGGIGAALVERLVKCPQVARVHSLSRAGRSHPSPKVANLTFDFTDEESLIGAAQACLLYTSPSPRDLSTSRMPSSA